MYRCRYCTFLFDQIVPLLHMTVHVGGLQRTRVALNGLLQLCSMFSSSADKVFMKFIKTNKTLHPKGYVSRGVDDNGDHSLGQAELPQCAEKPHHLGAHDQANVNKFT